MSAARHAILIENIATAQGLAEAIAECSDSPDLDGVRDVARQIMERLDRIVAALDSPSDAAAITGHFDRELGQ